MLLPLKPIKSRSAWRSCSADWLAAVASWSTQGQVVSQNGIGDLRRVVGIGQRGERNLGHPVIGRLAGSRRIAFGKDISSTTPVGWWQVLAVA